MSSCLFWFFVYFLRVDEKFDRKTFFATGTLRENRLVNKSVSPLITSDDLKTKPGGSYDCIFDSQNKETAVK